MKKIISTIVLIIGIVLSLHAQTIQNGSMWWDGNFLYTAVVSGKVVNLEGVNSNKEALHLVLKLHSKKGEYVIEDCQDAVSLRANTGWRVQYIHQDGVNCLVVRDINGRAVWIMTLTQYNLDYNIAIEHDIEKQPISNLLSRHILNTSYLSNFSKSQLRIMRNEVFARKGYRFQSEDLREYFNRQSWYEPNNSDVPISFSMIEQLNVQLIKSEEEVPDAYRHYDPNNVRITHQYPPENKRETKNEDQISIDASGTGFLIDKSGYLATNNHVTKGAKSIYVCLQIDGVWKSYNAVLVKTDPINDLSIIRIDDSEFKPFISLPYNFSTEVADVASEIYTLGYPQVHIMGTDVKYTTGAINSKSGIQGDPTHYQISAHIDHGNSGGPMFNSKGTIIGITDSGLDKAEFGDVNYAIKASYLKSLVDALPMNLELPHDNSIEKLSRVEQIKVLSNYTALILIDLP